ncbi:DNA-binding protein RFX6 [Rhipicephalus sanguineus]|uniref:DNA-binding protein RFX6 n=1 Tax=Rhipicephalus sanguineus TaxID=34632 RepID=UPI0020C39EF2|nr:DNA-binding protein RFX6 [Rhipicephalus sanguineus]
MLAMMNDAKKQKSLRKRRVVECDHRNKDTLEWVSANYIVSPGVCLPRCTLYQHYLDHCRRSSKPPMGAAAFGKLIRQKFPAVTTRRLGTRGQSRYHYYGIGLKPTSFYYDQAYCGKDITRFSGQKVKCIEGEQIKQPAPCTSRKKWMFIPDVRDLSPTETVDLTKAEGFLSMYRAHCCSLLDAILIADFKAVQDMVLHFWSSLQEVFLSLLHSAIVCDIVSVWDDYLYAAMQEILTPREIQELPQSFQQELSLFTSQLPDWLRSVIPASLLLQTKIRVLQEWTKVFKRQMSFTKLAQSCRSVLSNACYTQNMLDDLSKLVMDETVEEAFACLQNGRTASAMGVAELLSLLKKHASVEDLTEWMDMALDNAATEAGHSGTMHCRSVIYKDFMLSWMLLFSAIMRHLTLSRAQSFGHVHMLRVMIEEYMLLAFETSVGKESRLQRQEKLLTWAKDPDAVRTGMATSYAALIFQRAC